MEKHEPDEVLELLQRAERRALSRLRSDLSVLLAGFSDQGALERAVLRHPLLSVAGASAAGVGLVLVARRAARSLGRLIRALCSPVVPLGLLARGRARRRRSALADVGVWFLRGGRS